MVSACGRAAMADHRALGTPHQGLPLLGVAYGPGSRLWLGICVGGVGRSEDARTWFMASAPCVRTALGEVLPSSRAKAGAASELHDRASLSDDRRIG